MRRSWLTSIEDPTWSPKTNKRPAESASEGTPKRLKTPGYIVANNYSDPTYDILEYLLETQFETINQLILANKDFRRRKGRRNLEFKRPVEQEDRE